MRLSKHSSEALRKKRFWSVLSQEEFWLSLPFSTLVNAHSSPGAMIVCACVCVCVTLSPLMEFNWIYSCQDTSTDTHISLSGIDGRQKQIDTFLWNFTALLRSLKIVVFLKLCDTLWRSSYVCFAASFQGQKGYKLPAREPNKKSDTSRYIAHWNVSPYLNHTLQIDKNIYVVSFLVFLWHFCENGVNNSAKVVRSFLPINQNLLV